MALGKKGQVFTLVFILIVTFVFVSFEIYTFISQSDSVKYRVNTMNTFLNSIEKNLEGQLYVSGYRIIFLAETEITGKCDINGNDCLILFSYNCSSCDSSGNRSHLLSTIIADLADS